ncbi:MAG: STM4013/SEN3800 family hydrolase [Candidatus Lokiarchaeota archaeon]|nr:STM4013/SEN3800 family hydrolase [Candidatus Lokiarchaeota archaeon]
MGIYDILFVTVDSLRYDVACNCLKKGTTPNLERLLPENQWEKRHTPGNYTLPAHLSFFSGFFPTPENRPKASRLFAVKFPQNDTVNSKTFVFDAPNIVKGFEKQGYHTICVGGVGFFNKSNYLGNILPSFFLESHWKPPLGTTSRTSTEKQIDVAIKSLTPLEPSKRAFLFMNVSATHRPSHIFLEGARRDSIETQEAALEYVDFHLQRLFEFMGKRAPTLVIICSDHGEAFGEDGYFGHRLSHPVVWDVPYAEFLLGRDKKE